MATEAANPNVKILTQKRALFDQIAYDNKYKYKLPNAIQLPGYLRSEVILGAGQNSVTFPIRTDEAVPGQVVASTENRLNLNDAFYPTHYGVMFYDYLTTGTAAAVALARATARLQTFANDDVFAGNVGAVSAAFAGKLALRVDSTVYMDSLDMQRFVNARLAQQGTAISSVAVTGVLNQNDWSQNEMFMESVDPLVRLNGPSRNLFTVTFPEPLTFTAVADHAVVIVLYLRGWLSQNGGAQRTADNT